MPRGRGGGGGGRKGGRRQFTNFEAESEKKEREEKEARWRAQRGEADSDEESGSGESGSESEESSEEEGEAKAPKPKGVSGLIEQRNPNRTGVKENRKVTDLPEGGVKVELSRREREEIKKQQYVKLQEECKTDQARADLERLAIIRARRAEAEAKRKEEMEAKEAANVAKKETLPKVGPKKKS
ncbi:28 kDa heat- and acid-stable phosphoprotein [Hyalella azteca]|uniref:28 kDa heat- and acid-stable phosphoprotein n=1 Tax=Hyalella azteca TaxID=294128 RepID=A0A979FI33_HYAAZ|nr:28 kDa heat- and acid-stable phosphoprotein [Hyalella azteca]